ncbi:MAG: glycoside hydrolase family 15 protein [Bdellovibrionales bacterium]|nr:glycoside hydrolase family 15 protein [Bdellovibrionales bacterium]
MSQTAEQLFEPRYFPIEDYGIIGDLRTAALVGPNGCIDFLCWPRFDSPSIFCANADCRKGGRFQLAPLLDDVRQKRLYLPDTNILLSRFLANDGIAEVSDFMVLADGDSEQALVRRAKCIHGRVRFRMVLDPRFDYARASHRVIQHPGEAVFISEGPDRLTLRLRTVVPLQVQENGSVVADFELEPGESVAFVLEEAKAGEESPSAQPNYAADAFKRTSNHWRRWLSFSKYDGRWREMVHRSALALKLLTSREYGSIIAAPCFGFPNEIGGERNWDYRYTWVRDASFTVYGLMRLGFTDSAAAFMHWLEQRCAELADGGSLQIMYRINGEPINEEIHLDHLEGYCQSRPVRIGSTNHDQLQLDIYGELMDSVYLYDKYGDPISHDMWMNMIRLIEFVCANWKKPDAGIWEVRSTNQQFLYSRFMCWVAVDRGIRLAQKRSLPAPLDKWLKVRDRIYHSVHKDFWNAQKQAFVQFKGASAMDASTLMMPLVRFISPTDPRWLSTLAAIEQDLVHDSLVYRYRVGEAFSDMLAGGEGTFSICSFWYIECISRTGNVQKARYLLEKMLGYANNLGLFSEQLGPRGDFLGNVPQAFTHLALISAAFDLDRRLSATGKRES